jgi:polysaccharide pyruvyl transferase WcaK-like protein
VRTLGVTRSGATPTHFGYIGWTGHGNLGDDAIAEAIRVALAPARLSDVPLYPHDLAQRLKGHDRFGLRRAHPLLGGGTVIGRTNWRVHVRTALLLAWARPAVMIGAGVEDPAFSGTHSFSSPQELGRWRRVLGHFDRVTVRGPRSRDLLGDVGIEAEVVGDPALLLRPTRAVDAEDRTLGVALGFGDDLWGHSQDDVIDAIGSAIRALVGRGWRVRFFIVNPEDRADAMACARRAGLDPEKAELLTTSRSAEFMDQVSRCTVVVGERLHAVVLAAAAGVPAVMVEYQPKCRDFMASIDRSEWCVRTDEITPMRVLERVEALADDRAGHAAQIDGAVNVLRGRLGREVTRMRVLAGLDPVATTQGDARREIGTR